MTTTVVEARATGINSRLSIASAISSMGNKGLAPDAPVPALALDFTVGELDPRITFSRLASGHGGTYFDANGVLREAKVNLLLQSNALTTTWSVSTDIALVQNGDAWDATISNSNNGVYQSLTCVASTTYTLSFYVKLGTLAGGNFRFAIYNNSTPGFIASDIQPSQTLSTTEYVRIVYSFTTPVGCISIRPYLFRYATATSGTFSLKNAQLETGSAASTYIPTTTAAAAAPRFESVGLLIEESRANLFLNSLFDGTSLTTQSITVTAAPWTVSFYGTGTITFSGAYTGSALVGTGANTRVTATFTPSAGTLTCTVSGQVKWAQAELGAFATSFIPTAGTSLTRTADSASMTGTAFSSWFTQAEGTFVVQADTRVSLVDQRFILTKNAGGTNSIGLSKNASNSVKLINRVPTNYDVTTAGTLTTGSIKVAGAYGTGTSMNGCCYNGGAVAVSSPASQAADINQMWLCTDGYGFVFLNGTISRLTYWPKRLPDATLKALTA